MLPFHFAYQTGRVNERESRRYHPVAQSVQTGRITGPSNVVEAPVAIVMCPMPADRSTAVLGGL